VFDPEEAGTANWLGLKIVTEELEENTKLACGICNQALVGNKKEMDCKHLYHDACLQKLKGLEAACVLCHL